MKGVSIKGFRKSYFGKMFIHSGEFRISSSFQKEVNRITSRNILTENEIHFRLKRWFSKYSWMDDHFSFKVVFHARNYWIHQRKHQRYFPFIKYLLNSHIKIWRESIKNPSILLYLATSAILFLFLFQNVMMLMDHASVAEPVLWMISTSMTLLQLWSYIEWHIIATSSLHKMHKQQLGQIWAS